MVTNPKILDQLTYVFRSADRCTHTCNDKRSHKTDLRMSPHFDMFHSRPFGESLKI